jgi:hypothetical protein
MERRHVPGDLVYMLGGAGLWTTALDRQAGRPEGRLLHLFSQKECALVIATTKSRDSELVLSRGRVGYISIHSVVT